MSDEEGSLSIVWLVYECFPYEPDCLLGAYQSQGGAMQRAEEQLERRGGPKWGDGVGNEVFEGGAEAATGFSVRIESRPLKP